MYNLSNCNVSLQFACKLQLHSSNPQYQDRLRVRAPKRGIGDRVCLEFICNLCNFRNLQCQITKCTICQIAMSVCNLHANCNLIVKSTISRQAKGYSTYMRYRGQGMLRIYLQFAQFAQLAMSNYKMYNLSNCNVSLQFACKLQLAMSVCNLHANCNLIVKSTISRQAKGYSTYMRYSGTGYAQNLFAICAICAICNVKLQNVQFVKLQCQFAICMQIAT